jgi:hypothetical protein
MANAHFHPSTAASLVETINLIGVEATTTAIIGGQTNSKRVLRFVKEADEFCTQRTLNWRDILQQVTHRSERLRPSL